MLRLRTLAAVCLTFATGTAAAQDVADRPISDRQAQAAIRALSADPDVASVELDNNGDIVVEPVVRAPEALERWRLLDTPEGRAALRALSAGGRAPNLSELDREVLGLLASQDDDRLNTRFGWTSRGVAELEGIFAAQAGRVVPGVLGGTDDIAAGAADPATGVPAVPGAGGVDGGYDSGPDTHDPIVPGPGTVDAGDAAAGGPTPAIPNTPGAKAPGGAVYRYACCENLPLREQPSKNAVVDHTVDPNESLVVLGLHAPFIHQLVDELEECLPQNDCANLANQLGAFDLNIYAEVRVTNDADRQGWTPLVALFKTPRQATDRTLPFQVGYNRIIDALAVGLDQIFEPSGCEAPAPYRMQDNTAGQYSAHTVYWTGSTAQRCAFAVPDTEAKDVCNVCEPIFETIFGEDGEYDVMELIGHPLQDAYNTECYRFTGPNEAKQTTNRSAYTCGEYPIGKTHYANTINNEETEVFETDLWSRTLRVRMGRAHHQRAFSATQWDMAEGGNAQFDFGKRIDHRNFWLSLQPLYDPPAEMDDDHIPTGDHKLLVHVCGHLPGGYVDAPFIDFHWKDTYKDAFNKIDFGHLEWDRIKMCATAKLSMDANLTPSLEWVEVNDLQVKGANISNVKVVFAAWVYIANIAVGVFGGGIGAHISMILTKLMQYLPAIINVLPNEEYLIGDLLPEALRTLMHTEVLKQLNSATEGALMGINLDAYLQQEEMCGMALPELPEDHPLHFFNAYLMAECQQMVDTGIWGPFLPHAASANQDCYGSNRYFNPGLTGETEDHAFSRFEGQDWYTDAEEDSGCRLTFGRHASVDSRLWPVLRCMTAQTNLFVNAGNGLPDSLEGLPEALTQACGQVALDTLEVLYGNGSDLLDLIEIDPGQMGGFMGD